MIELNFNKPMLETFIRNTLGCGCPSEVFEKMTCSKETLGGIAGTSIDVGGRLLVFLTAPKNEEDVASKLESLLKAGIDKRDECNFNRLRLVVPADPAHALAADLQCRFEELRGEDEKLHLHVLHPATIPAFLTVENVPE
jgi:hypothetical protein